MSQKSLVTPFMGLDPVPKENVVVNLSKTGLNKYKVDDEEEQK